MSASAGPWARRAWLGLALLLGVVAFLPAWLVREVDRDDVQRGSFEEDPAGVVVQLEDDSAADFFNSTTFEPDRRSIQIFPGTLVAIALRDGESVQVDADASGLLPYVVVGWRDRTSGRTPSLSRFVDGQVVEVRDGKLALAPWNPDRPWTADEAWLTTLGAACGSGSDTGFRVALDGPSVLDVRAGTCHSRFELPPDPAGRSVAVLALGATSARAVTKEPSTRSTVRFSPRSLGLVLAMTVAEVAALSFAFGTASTVGILATLLLASFLVGPVLAMAATWFLLLFAGIPIILARALRKRHWSLRILAAAGFPVVLVVAGAWFLGSRFGPNASDRLEVQQRGPDARCMLTGYSTTLNHNLLKGADGLFEHLADSCPACGGGVLRKSRNAGDLEDVARAACDDSDGVPIPPTIVFYGGVNDDFIFALNREPVHVILRVAYSVMRLFTQRQSLDFHGLMQAMEPSATASLARVGEQEQAIRNAAACARRRGGSLWMFQDLFAPDLRDPRSPARVAMLERRRVAAESEGGHLVDVLAATRETVGVSWFADPMHLSAVGHRRVAELVGRSLEGSPAAQTGLP